MAEWVDEAVQMLGQSTWTANDIVPFMPSRVPPENAIRRGAFKQGGSLDAPLRRGLVLMTSQCLSTVT